MKKIITTALASLGLLTLTSCGDPIRGHNLESTTIVNTHGYDQEAFINPTVVGILNWSVLDVLYSVNAFEKLYFIETIMIPQNSTVPGFIETINFNASRITRQNGTHINIINSGSLHFVNEDNLLLVQPQVVFLDHRSFAQTGTGAATDEGHLGRVAERFRYTSFLHLYNDVTNLQAGFNLEEDLAMLTTALSKVFPSLADDLETKYEATVTSFEEIRSEVKALELNALHISLQGNITIHGSRSRWSMIFDTFGFNPVVEDSISNVSQEIFINREDINEADVMFVFTHPNAGAGEFDAFVNNQFVEQTNASENNGIFHIRAAAWHSSPLGFTSAEWMIQDVQNLLAQRNS